jgi:hypothetical protein
MRLENYIMEQDINTASVADIFVEQAQAEMNVIASIVESYTKDMTMEQFIQEGVIKDATAVAKGSKYESKIKRVVAFIPRFFAQLFKLLIAKLKKVNNPINAVKSKFSKVPEDVKESAVIPISKENLDYATKCINEIEKILERSKFEDLIDSIADIDGTAKGNGLMLKMAEDAEKLAKALDNYDVEKRIQLSLQIWQNNKDKQEKQKLSYGKTTMNVTVDDGSPAKSSVSMPDLVMKSPETKDLVTIAEFEQFAKQYVKDREDCEAICKDAMQTLNEAKKEGLGNPEKLKSGVEISSPVSGIDSDFGKYMDMLIKSMNKLSASFTKLFDAIEKGFMNVLKDTKAFKAYKTPKASTKYNDESLADGYKIDANNTSGGNWGSSRTKSGGDYGRVPGGTDSLERQLSYWDAR